MGGKKKVEMTPLEPLELVASEELFRELSRRYTGFLAVYEQSDGNARGSALGIWSRSNSTAHMMGLADYLHAEVRRAMHRFIVDGERPNDTGVID